MRCPVCSFENASGIKFCGECSAALKIKCSRCGFDNALGMKFCGECGKPLAEATKPAPRLDPRSYTPKHLAEKILTSRSALEGERKQVTVLFADVKGSMGAHRLTPSNGAWSKGTLGRRAEDRRQREIPEKINEGRPLRTHPPHRLSRRDDRFLKSIPATSMRPVEIA
jgi:hypothetical protein